MGKCSITLTALVMILASSADSRAQYNETYAADQKAISHSSADVRMPALYRVKYIGMIAPDSPTKLAALNLLHEPVKSSHDDVRIPAIYAIMDIACSAGDVSVQRDALEALGEPIKAKLFDVRHVSIDAVNTILNCSKDRGSLVDTVLNLLAEPIASQYNTIRMPAINAVVRSVEGSGRESAFPKALELLREPMKSKMKEIRFMAIDAVERIGVAAQSGSTKDMAVDMLRAAGGSKEPDVVAGRAKAAELKIRGARTE